MNFLDLRDEDREVRVHISGYGRALRRGLHSIFARPIRIALMVAVCIFLPAKLQALQASYSIDEAASSAILEEASKVIGQDLPNAKKASFFKVEKLVLVLRFEDESHCFNQACLTYVIDLVGGSHPNFASIVAHTNFTVSDTSSASFEKSGVLIFQGVSRTIDVVYTGTFVAVE